MSFAYVPFCCVSVFVGFPVFPFFCRSGWCPFLFTFPFLASYPGSLGPGPGTVPGRSVSVPFRFRPVRFPLRLRSRPLLCLHRPNPNYEILEKSIIHFYLKSKFIFRPVRFPFRLRSRLLLCLHHPNRKL